MQTKFYSWELTNNINCEFSQFWKLHSSRSAYHQIWCLKRYHFMIHRCILFLSVLTWPKGLKRLSGVISVRALIHVWRLGPHDLITSKNSYLLITSPLWFDFSMWNLQGHKHLNQCRYLSFTSLCFLWVYFFLSFFLVS